MISNYSIDLNVSQMGHWADFTNNLIPLFKEGFIKVAWTSDPQTD